MSGLPDYKKAASTPAAADETEREHCERESHEWMKQRNYVLDTDLTKLLLRERAAVRAECNKELRALQKDVWEWILGESDDHQLLVDVLKKYGYAEDDL